MGMELPVQIAPMTATASDLVTLAVLAGGRRRRDPQGAGARRRPRRRGYAGVMTLLPGGRLAMLDYQTPPRASALPWQLLPLSAAKAQTLVANVGAGPWPLLSARSAGRP